jgi:hypothetical protein
MKRCLRFCNELANGFGRLGFFRSEIPLLRGKQT